MKWGLKKGKDARINPRTGSGTAMRPVRDWLLGLCMASVIFLGAAAFIAYDFRIQFVLPPEPPESASVDVTYSEDDVLYYAERFDERDVRFKALRGNAPVIVPLQVESGEPDESLADDASGEYTTPTLSP